MKKSIGNKIVYPAFSKYGYVTHGDAHPDSIQGVTYKEALVLRISNDTSITAASVISRANQIIDLLDMERERDGTESK
jgi:hypothetical protein